MFFVHTDVYQIGWFILLSHIIFPNDQGLPGAYYTTTNSKRGVLIKWSRGSSKSWETVADSLVPWLVPWSILVQQHTYPHVCHKFRGISTGQRYFELGFPQRCRKPLQGLDLSTWCTEIRTLFDMPDDNIPAHTAAQRLSSKEKRVNRQRKRIWQVLIFYLI